MTWTAPMTAVANEIWTSAQFNTHVRDNFLETAPAIVTGSGQHLVSDGANSLVARSSDSDTITTEESTSSTSYTDLSTTGPEITITTGSAVLVHIATKAFNNTSNATCFAGFRISGATSVSLEGGEYVTYTDALPANQEFSVAMWAYYDQLNPGSHTFTMQYKVSHGTGSWSDRHMIVLAL